jgi:thioredoxin 1
MNMTSLTLTRDNRDTVLDTLTGSQLVVACLCAAWCGTCGSYRATFDQLAQKHRDKLFVWIDIEDQADAVGDLDVDNFPTLLIQRGDAVAFFGTVTPEANVADRLVAAQAELDDATLARLTAGSGERRTWQEECNLRELLTA